MEFMIDLHLKAKARDQFDAQLFKIQMFQTN